MTRKDEIRCLIESIEQQKKYLDDKKQILIEEAQKIKAQPLEIIKELLENDGHIIYDIGENSYMYYNIYVHIKLRDDLSVVTRKIYDATGFTLHAFQPIVNTEQHKIWFRKFT